MIIKLRMLQGQFQKANGRRSDEIKVGRPMYFIGSDASCNLRIPAKGISPRHCAIMTDGDFISVNDLNSETGVFLNDHRINGSAVLNNGDLIRIGSMEFEFVAEGLAPKPEDDDAAQHAMDSGRWRGAPDMLNPTPPPEDVDKMDGDITDMLVREDENARKHRLSHPDELRYDTAELKARNQELIEAEADQARADEERKLSEESQQKKSKHKLAKPGGGVVKGADATEAAEKMLSNFFKPRT